MGAGYEHVEALGGNIQSIAAAKAGIMKPGRPVVVGRQQHPEALKVLEDTAQRLACPFVQASENVCAHRLVLRESDCSQLLPANHYLICQYECLSARDRYIAVDTALVMRNHGGLD